MERKEDEAGWGKSAFSCHLCPACGGSAGGDAPRSSLHPQHVRTRYLCAVCGLGPKQPKETSPKPVPSTTNQTHQQEQQQKAERLKTKPTQIHPSRSRSAPRPSNTEKINSPPRTTLHSPGCTNGQHLPPPPDRQTDTARPL